MPGLQSLTTNSWPLRWVFSRFHVIFTKIHDFFFVFAVIQRAPTQASSGWSHRWRRHTSQSLVRVSPGLPCRGPGQRLCLRYLYAKARPGAYCPPYHRWVPKRPQSPIIILMSNYSSPQSQVQSPNLQSPVNSPQSSVWFRNFAQNCRAENFNFMEF